MGNLIGSPNLFDPGNLELFVPLSFRNLTRDNGGFEIWQRGTSIAQAASLTGYTADRWYLITAANQASVVSRQAGLTLGSQYCARVQRNSGQTGVGAMIFGYPLDIDQIAALRSNIAALTFNVNAGANWTPASGTLSYAIYFGTGSVAKRGAGFTNEKTLLSGTINLIQSGPSTPVINIGSKLVPPNVTQGEIQFTWTPVGTASTNDWFQIDDLQLEALGGLAVDASPFERLSFEDSLSLCQFYYAKTFAYGTTPATSAGVVGALAALTPVATANISAYWQFPRPMRISPTITTFNPSAGNANWRDRQGGADVTVSVDPGTAKSERGIFIGSSATVGTINRDCYIHATAEASI